LSEAFRRAFLGSSLFGVGEKFTDTFLIPELDILAHLYWESGDLDTAIPD